MHTVPGRFVCCVVMCHLSWTDGRLAHQSVGIRCLECYLVLVVHQAATSRAVLASSSSLCMQLGQAGGACDDLWCCPHLEAFLRSWAGLKSWHSWSPGSAPASRCCGQQHRWGGPYEESPWMLSRSGMSGSEKRMEKYLTISQIKTIPKYNCDYKH